MGITKDYLIVGNGKEVVYDKIEFPDMDSDYESLDSLSINSSCREKILSFNFKKLYLHDAKHSSFRIHGIEDISASDTALIVEYTKHHYIVFMLIDIQEKTNANGLVQESIHLRTIEPMPDKADNMSCH